jgi:Flp pilus assembly protein TadG
MPSPIQSSSLQRREKSARRTEDGQALILFTLAMTVLLGFVAMTVDVGQYMYSRTQMQNAADSAALAGAAELPASPANAISEATTFAIQNGLKNSDIQSITVSTTHSTNDTITVKLNTPFYWNFAQVLGLLHTTVVAQAAAAVGSPASDNGLAPWSVVDSAINWSSGPTVLKYDSNNPQNGNFGALAIDGSGASTYTNTIETGSTASLCAQGQPGCSDPTATTKPGNMVGPTKTGVDYLLANTSSACDTFAEVLQQLPDGTYSLAGRCNRWAGVTDSKRVVLIPVISSLCNGNCSVTVLYFAMFFLNSLDSCTGNSCQVTGQFAKVVTDPNAVIGSFDSHHAIRAYHLIS